MSLVVGSKAKEPTPQQKPLSEKQGVMWKVPSPQAPGLQEALDAAKPGDCIFLSPGTYTLTSPVSICKPVHIIGVNEVGASAAIEFLPNNLRPAVAMLVIDAPDCRIKGVQFTYAHRTGSASTEEIGKTFAISVRAAASVTFDECKLVSSVSGIKILEKAYVTMICANVSAAGVGAQVEGRLHLNRSDIGHGSTGVFVDGIGHFTAEGSIVTDCETGVRSIKHAILKLDGCLVSGCKVGVHISDPNPAPKPPALRGNEVVGCETGILVAGGRCHTEITKNFVHKCTKNGIFVNGGTSEIKANAVKDCAGFGIHLALGQQQVEGNIVQNCAVAAILCRSARPTIIGNELVGNATREDSVGLLVYHPPAPPPAPRVLGSAAPGVASTSPAAANLTPASSTGLAASVSPGSLPLSRSGNYSAKFVPPAAAAVETEDMQYDLDDFTEPTDDIVADPMVEGNVFGENSMNIRVVRASGAYHKNELLPSIGCSVTVVGMQVVPAVVADNEILGSTTSYGVYVAAGSQAKVHGNHITNAKLSGIVLKGCGPSEVHSNVIDFCLDAIVAQGRAVGRIGSNHTTLPVDVFSDSTDTMKLEH